jgi:hypothetical protein
MKDEVEIIRREAIEENAGALGRGRTQHQQGRNHI